MRLRIIPVFAARWLNKLSIKIKLAIMPVILALASLMVGYLLITNIQGSLSMNDKAATGFNHALYAKELQVLSLRIESALKNTVDIEESMDEAEVIAETMRQTIAFLDENQQQNLGEQQALADFDRAFKDFYTKAVAEAKIFSGDADYSSDEYTEKVSVLATNQYQAAEALLNEYLRVATSQSTLANGKLKSVQQSSISLLVSLFLVILIATLMVARDILRPLHHTVAALEDIAQGEGDLTKRLPVTRGDEFGQLARVFNQFADKIHDVLVLVKQATETMVSGTNEIARGNNRLSHRTEEQASALEETASSMEEMTGTSRHNADNANSAKRLAETNRQYATEGADVVMRTIDAMDNINESSSRVGDIINTIDGIAFQTNLLALNAAVEAARAGEQGRGFAVVAGEVRSLAQRSAEAAKEIKSLIEESSNRVQAGTRLVDESGKTLEAIIDGTRKLSDMVTEISIASNEQVADIDQVNNTITAMDSMTQENAALVEQTAAASRAMEEQAEKLVQQISFFKLEEGDQQQPALAIGDAEQFDSQYSYLGAGTLADLH